MPEVSADTLSLLRTRTSEKWRAFGPDVLPLFVAETDYPLAEPIARDLVAAVRRSDTGYISPDSRLPLAFAGFAERRWGWTVDPGQMTTTTDVSVAIVEVLRGVIAPGDGVVITPPIYPPFFELVPEAGGTAVEVPLLRDDRGWGLDLDGIETAFAAGATAVLLCNPHNPVGHVHPVTELAALAELAEAYGATVVSDEIHGPLTMPHATFTPFLSVSDAARHRGVCVTAPSKAFNLAGLKCALIVTDDPAQAAMVARMPREVVTRTGIFGLISAITAYGGECDDWLDGLILGLDSNRLLLGELLAERLPDAVYSPPAATYLAWLDLSALGWGDDPSGRALELGVAINPGPSFGREGAGFARLNFACSPEVLREAIDRLAQ
ncbi:MAG: aspartate aminotransferase [Microbacteriaceae bacterium]|nr:aspartate aminotransferase [Microbacteriaceae bacterium]